MSGPPKKRFTPKKMDALLLRDKAFQKLQADGRFEAVKGGPAMPHWRGCGFTLSMRTPFQVLPPMSEELKHFAATQGRRAHWPYELDIWFEGQGKVFSFLWDGTGEFYMGTFKRGEWEAEFLAVKP